jgi:hypothetical protein
MQFEKIAGAEHMQSFTKKPVTIQAKQLTESAFTADHPSAEHIVGVVYDSATRTASIKTLEGVMTAQIGDWIIRGVKGELYPCKPDIFAATYEPASE